MLPSGPTPILAWTMPGLTPAGAPRRFALVPGAPAPTAASDLRVVKTDQGITVSTSYFEVTHPRRGGGGFPRDVRLRVSGNRDSELHFLDRLFRRDPNSKPEARSPKLETRNKLERRQTQEKRQNSRTSVFFFVWISCFEFVSSFGFRVSSFALSSLTPAG